MKYLIKSGLCELVSDLGQMGGESSDQDSMRTGGDALFQFTIREFTNRFVHHSSGRSQVYQTEWPRPLSACEYGTMGIWDLGWNAGRNKE